MSNLSQIVAYRRSQGGSVAGSLAGGIKEKLKEKTHLARCVELVAECFYFKFIQSQEELDNILLIDFIKKTIFYISGQMSMYKNTQEFMLNSTPFDVVDMMVDYFYSC